MWKLDGRTVFQDQPFWHDGIAYPANWITMSSQADKDAIGLTWITPDPRPDDRYYYVQDNGDGTYTSTPKDLDDLKASEVSRAKSQANAMLASTDWYVVRRGETGEPVPDTVATYRADVRNSCAAIESQIIASTTVEELQAVEWLWPSTPEGAAR